MMCRALTLIIAAGGKSRRMGCDKRLLMLGEETMLERVLRRGRAAGFRKIILAVEAESSPLRPLAEKYGAQFVCDAVRAQGPVSALSAGLAAAETEWSLVLSIDLPFFDFSFVQDLLAWTSGVQAVVPRVGDGAEPLAALYRKDASVTFAAALARGERRLQAILAELPVRYVLCEARAAFFNVNTPAAYRLACGRYANSQRAVPLLSILAPASGTGKTTFIEQLIPALLHEGVRAAVIKSDAHGFQLDIDGKDTARFRAAGAAAVAIASPQGWFLWQQAERRPELSDLVEKMDREGINLVLTEGRTQGELPAFFLYRGLGAPQIDARCAAVFAKERVLSWPEQEIFQYGLDDIAAAVRVTRFLMGARGDV